MEGRRRKACEKNRAMLCMCAHSHDERGQVTNEFRDRGRVHGPTQLERDLGRPRGRGGPVHLSAALGVGRD